MTFETWEQMLFSEIKTQIPESREISIQNNHLYVDGCLINYMPVDFKKYSVDESTTLGVPEWKTLLAMLVEESIIKLKGWYYWMERNNI
jgi:hypothetical protein